MQRVFVNMSRSTIDAMPDSAKLIASKRSPESVEVPISDTGSGILHDLKGRIWKPLKTTKTKGVGLGLAIRQSIVEAHRDRTEVYGETGKGKTCKIILPTTGLNNKRFEAEHVEMA
jgi:signal transduction histidine kinase